MRAGTAPRISLALLPTPLVPAPRLSAEIGVEVWFKRDDLTGLGLGGNKVRALEFLIGAAEAAGSDCLITGGGPQSNWVMLAALAAITRGLDAHVVYFGPEVESTGNLQLLRSLPGIEITFTGDPVRASVDPVLDAVAGRLSSAGHHPFLIGRGGAGPIGGLGYLHATLEIDRQAEQTGFATVWTATGSCGTQAGLVAGHAVSTHRRRVVGVSVHRPVEECVERIGAIARGTLELYGASAAPHPDWEVLGGQLGRDPAAERRVEEAARLVARTEGVFLDPEFAAPAMAELVARAAEVEGPVLFLVSGGGPTLLTEGAFA
ncbi:MAG: 1-aminocyclopropane-1-carboxylate deaminase/D-cysteine desulfhydrase [Acidimicrobiia bacterium]